MAFIDFILNRIDLVLFNTSKEPLVRFDLKAMRIYRIF